MEERSHPYIDGPAGRPFGPLSRPRGGFECFEIGRPCIKITSFPLSRKRNRVITMCLCADSEGRERADCVT
jgi:hypothetical protein